MDDELLLTLPIALHEHDLLLHLRRVVVQLHVFYLYIGELAAELSHVVQQELYKAETRIKIEMPYLREATYMRIQ